MKGQIPWNKGKKASAAARKKLSLAHQNPSAETRRKMSLAKKGKTPWNKGRKSSAATRKKISLAKRNPSAETRRKMSLSKKGKKLSPEHIAKIRSANKNPSAATRKKISLALKGKTPWNKGKKHSAEHVGKISRANTGQKRSATIRRKQSLAHNRALKENPEYRRKLSLAQQGSKNSAATRKKISQAHENRSDEDKKKSELRRLATIKKRFPKGNVPGTLGHIPWHKGKTGVFSDEAIKKIRKRRSEQVLPRKNTLPERMLQELLKSEKIDFIPHKNFNLEFQWHQVDIFLEPNICIEVDGDHMHANPKPHRKRKSSKYLPGYKPDKIMWRSSKTIKTAKSIWESDKKITKALKRQGNTVLRFWQSEIEYEPEKCLQKIKNIIK